MTGFFSKPYDLLENNTFKNIFVFGGLVFSFLFLWVFEPFGLYNLTGNEKLFAIGLYIVVGLIILVLQYFVFQHVIIKQYTVLNTILWIILSTFLIGLSSAVVNAFLFNDGHFYFLSFVLFQGIILSINIIFVPIFILVHYNISLHKRLKAANSFNDKLSQETVRPATNDKLIKLNSDNKKEGMEIGVDDFLFLRSQDNYIEINYLEDQSLKKDLVRYSLLKFENDNRDVPEIIRCHKGYIVNKLKIDSISGNAAGYKLKISGCDDIIPVSRSLNTKLETLLSGN